MGRIVTPKYRIESIETFIRKDNGELVTHRIVQGFQSKIYGTAGDKAAQKYHRHAMQAREVQPKKFPQLSADDFPVNVGTVRIIEQKTGREVGRYSPPMFQVI